VFTRPREFEGMTVPDVLASGDHEAVRRWRLAAAVRLTLRRRPDLINAAWPSLPPETRAVIAAVAAEEGIALPQAFAGTREDPSRRS